MDDERPYRPSNSADGEWFESQWCAHCVKFQPEEGEYCDILLNAMASRIDDPEYPTEWVRSVTRGPRCKAFSEDRNAPPRCPLTADLFDEMEG